MPDLRANAGWLLRPGVLAKDQPGTWTDWEGREHKVPKRELNFSSPEHARLRDHVWRRDGYRCQACSALADSSGCIMRGADPVDVLCIDHIISRRNGGGNHPDNLQSLCRACNGTKSGLLDRTQKPSTIHLDLALSRQEVELVDRLAYRWSCTRQDAIRRVIVAAEDSR